MLNNLLQGTKNILLLAILLSLPLSVTARENIESVKAELRTLDTRVRESILNRDVAFLKNVLAEEFVWVHSNASPVQSKEQVLAELPKRRPSKSGGSHSEVVQVYGDAAILSSYRRTEYGDVSATFHAQRIYVKKKGVWKIVSLRTPIVLDEDEKDYLVNYLINKRYKKNSPE